MTKVKFVFRIIWIITAFTLVWMNASFKLATGVTILWLMSMDAEYRNLMGFKKERKGVK